MHTSALGHTVISACLLANLAIFMLNQNRAAVTQAAVFILVMMCIARMRQMDRNPRLLTAITLACLLTAIHASSNYYVNNIIFHVGLAFNPEFEAQSQIESSDRIDSWDRSLEHGLPILYEQTQTDIKVRQSTCHTNMTVYVVQRYGSGMGAEIHWHASVLALAMDHENALFAWGEGACKTYDAHCRELYEPEHACSEHEISQMKQNHVAFLATSSVPARFLPHLPKSFTPAQTEYWWRAQAIGYLMRFNSNTSKKIRDLRTQLHGNLSLDGAINVNVRAGDKTSEMILTPTEQIVGEAETLITSMPFSFSRTLFVTSDSMHEILKAKIYAEQRQLRVIYSDIPRMKHGHNQADVTSFWNINVTISVLLQLSMAAECDAWIGTRGSNWNRLIDIYRCTHAHKCKQAFVEAGDVISGHYDYNPGHWV